MNPLNFRAPPTILSEEIKASIFPRRPILSVVSSALITLVELLTLTALPVTQYPELVPPSVNVSVSYPGAYAETIASTVMASLEVNINGVEHAQYMVSSSASSSGQGSISVYFAPGTDPDMALVT